MPDLTPERLDEIEAALADVNGALYSEPADRPGAYDPAYVPAVPLGVTVAELRALLAAARRGAGHG